jgi:hypothetical protein
LESKALPKAPAPKATKHSSLKPSLAVFADNTRHSKNNTTTSNPDTRKIQVEVVKASRKHHAQSTEQRLHSSNLKSEEKESVNPGVPQMVKAEIKVAKKVKDGPVIPNKNKSGSKQRSGKLAKQKVTKPKTTKIAVEDDRVMSKATKPKSKKICKHLPPPLEIGADAQVNDKENAGCKPCLRVQIGLSAPSPKALPFFSPTHIDSPANSLSANERIKNPRMPFSPTQCNSPNTFSPRGAFFVSKSNQSDKNRPTPCKATYRNRAEGGIVDV